MNFPIKGVAGIGHSPQANNPQANKAITSQEPVKEETKSHLTPPTHAQILAKRHVTKIDDRSNDPAQYFPFHVDCACGYHSSVNSMAEAVATASLHRHRHGVKE